MGSSTLRPRRIEILGVPVDCVTMRSALDYVDELVRGAGTSVVIAVNPEKVIKAHDDRWLLDQLNAATLLLPDGIGIVWASRMLGLGYMERVPGADLMLALCERAASAGHRIFLYGASPEVNEQARAALEQSYPRLRIVGNRHGYVQPAEMNALIDEINASQADILFVALGSPRQEFWMSTHLAALRVKVIQGVGGTFDVISGKVRRAPERWRRLHLEWAYRLVTEPRRLPRQAALPKFAWQVLTTRRNRGNPAT